MKDEDFYQHQTLPCMTLEEEEVPHRIGPYRIESLLKKGGMSYLYLGLHPEMEKPIAIKVLSPKYCTNKEAASRFLKEAQIIGMADHPNIVKLYGQGRWERGLYIAMELVQGISLRQFILQKTLSPNKALEIVLQISYALCHLHTHGVIHRDLKPENILITDSGKVKVIDFGIAQLQGEEESTEQPRLMGTPVYMSPEQRDNSAPVTYSTDIYALSMIAYELILGRLSHGIIHLSLLPKALRPIIEKSLLKNPEKRTEDIVEFITEITHYLKTQEKEEPVKKPSIKMPSFPNAEIGLAMEPGMPLYVDFFKLPENRLCTVLAEPKGEKDSLLILRGMVRMAIQQAFFNGKKESHPIKILTALNQVLLDDAMEFAFSFLLLNPDKDQLIFVSCNHLSLWIIPEGSTKVRSVSTPNPPLGRESNPTWLETACNWTIGDQLVLQIPNVEPDIHNLNEKKNGAALVISRIL
jgi:serine/threonine protein kinase